MLGEFYFPGFGLGKVLGPHLIGRVGHIRSFVAMVAVICIAALSQALIVAPIFWWLTRALTGLALAALYIVIESWLNSASTSSIRGMVFSIYTVINLGVTTVGQPLTATADVGGFLLFAIATREVHGNLLASKIGYLLDTQSYTVNRPRDFYPGITQRFVCSSEAVIR